MRVLMKYFYYKSENVFFPYFLKNLKFVVNFIEKKTIFKS